MRAGAASQIMHEMLLHITCITFLIVIGTSSNPVFPVHYMITGVPSILIVVGSYLCWPSK